MELVTFDVPLGREPLAIMPIGDIQWAGGRGTAQGLLRREIDRGLAAKAWFIGLGDYIDFMSPSNRARLRSADLYDMAEDVIDDKALELTDELYEKFLKPTRGRWLGLLEGHHFTQLKTGESTDQHLARKLGCGFLGTCSYIRLNFRVGPSESKSYNFIIWAHHGCGGGSKVSAPLNKLENLSAYWDADLFIMGHMTKMAAAPINRVHPRWDTHPPTTRHRKIMLVGSGGFSKGYEVGAMQGATPRGSYVEQRLLSPAALGAPLVRIGHRNVHRGKTSEYILETTVEC